MGKHESKRTKSSKRKASSKEGQWTVLGLLNEGRDGIEEDSGLGDSVPFADEEACSNSAQSPYSSPLLLSKNGSSPHFAIVSRNEKVHSYQGSKRLRLDLPEEANELPEEKYSTGTQILPPILSFKNVPALLSPLKAIPEHGVEFRSTPSFAVQPLSIQRIAPAKVTMAAKEEKVSKKAANRHFLDKIFPSSSGTTQLELVAQPEEQHRARYQTEGSRGAVKDRSGQGHPIIKLKGYNKAAVLVTYVAWDGGSVAPHMFYQAYKVSGKNSTPCKEEKLQGTTLLQMDLLPEKDMTVSCDCVGLLKERNVDVEQRLKSSVYRGRRKSTKCRLVFRTTIKLDSGAEETLQIVSEPICCTQPPGVPEICRKSLSFCPHLGGQELFIIGKHFFKDTKIIFQDKDSSEESKPWKVTVTPDKDFLHPTHLICTVPPYVDGTLKEVEVQIVVTSCGKSSEAHPFKFLSSSTEEHSIGLSEDDRTELSKPRVDNIKDKMTVVNDASDFLSQRKRHGSSREQAIVHPLQIQKPLPSLTLYGSQGLADVRPVKVNEMESTPITPTTFGPLASTLNLTQSSHSHTSLFKQPTAPEPSYVSVPKKSSESHQTIIGNLVEMLKLARNTPIPTAQPAFVQMIADEIINQLDVNNTPQSKPYRATIISTEASPNPNAVSLAVNRENVKDEKYPTATTNLLFDQRQPTANTQQYNSIPPVKQSSLQGEGFPQFSTVDTMVLMPRSADPKLAEVKVSNYIINAHNGSLPLLTVEGCSTKTSASNPQSSIVLNTDFVQSTALPTPPTKKINLRPVTVSRQTLMTNSQPFVSKGDGISHQNGYESLNGVYLQGQTTKLETAADRLQTPEINLSPVLPVSRPQPQLYPSVTSVNQCVQTSCLEPTLDASKSTVNNTSLFKNQPELEHNSLNLNSISGNNLTAAQNILSSDPMTTKSHCLVDPLLSQSTSSTEIFAPQQVLHIESNSVGAQISQASSINSTISPEVTKRFEQLSENELINYFNPTCFDSV